MIRRSQASFVVVTGARAVYVLAVRAVPLSMCMAPLRPFDKLRLHRCLLAVVTTMPYMLSIDAHGLQEGRPVGPLLHLSFHCCITQSRIVRTRLHILGICTVSRLPRPVTVRCRSCPADIRGLVAQT